MAYCRAKVRLSCRQKNLTWLQMRVSWKIITHSNRSTLSLVVLHVASYTRVRWRRMWRFCWYIQRKQHAPRSVWMKRNHRTEFNYMENTDSAPNEFHICSTHSACKNQMLYWCSDLSIYAWRCISDSTSYSDIEGYEKMHDITVLASMHRCVFVCTFSVFTFYCLDEPVNYVDGDDDCRNG